MKQTFHLCPYQNCTVWRTTQADLKVHVKRDHKKIGELLIEI